MVAPQGTAKLRASGPARGLSIRQKLLALILLLVSGIVALLAVYLPSRQIAGMQSALQAKATTYSRLIAKEIAPAVAFDDQETAREVFESVAEDPDVESLTLLGARGNVLSARGVSTPELVARREPAVALEVFAGGERVSVVSPVVSLEGPRGTLIVELSQTSLLAQRKAVFRDALGVGLAALLLGGLGASLIASSLGRRLRAIGGVAEAIAAGDLEQRAPEVRGRLDEIDVVSVAFNAMLDRIRDLVAAIQRSAKDEQERLERLVAERTLDLDRRNGELKRVLDNVGQGFITLERSGKLSAARSRVLGEWFGAAAQSESFVELLASVAPERAQWFELGWQSLWEGVLPAEVCLEQLPRRVTVGERELGLEYRPILDAAGELEQVLVVVTDLTDVLARSRAEAHEREVTGLFTKLIADRTGFLEFFAEAHALVEHIAAAVASTVAATRVETVALTRAIHTLKGNAAIYGLETVAGLCHELEQRLVEGVRLVAADGEPLRRRWREISAKVKTLVEGKSGKIEIEDAEYSEILSAIERGVSHVELKRRIQAWQLEPAAVRLTRMAEHAKALAERLGKGPIDVQIESNHVRVEREHWAGFWAACVHVVRNAVDHGLEATEEREALGKRVPATLRFTTAISGDRFVVEFSDDGRGIDWAAVLTKAQSLGIRAETPEQQKEALFADGVSTKSEATEVSGRGVGLAAVRQACVALGGRVDVQSQLGSGTTLRFIWPASAAVARSDWPSAASSRQTEVLRGSSVEVSA